MIVEGSGVRPAGKLDQPPAPRRIHEGLAQRLTVQVQGTQPGHPWPRRSASLLTKPQHCGIETATAETSSTANTDHRERPGTTQRVRRKASHFATIASARATSPTETRTSTLPIGTLGGVLQSSCPICRIRSCKRAKKPRAGPPHRQGARVEVKHLVAARRGRAQPLQRPQLLRHAGQDGSGSGTSAASTASPPRPAA